MSTSTCAYYGVNSTDRWCLERLAEDFLDAQAHVAQQ